MRWPPTLLLSAVASLLVASGAAAEGAETPRKAYIRTIRIFTFGKPNLEVNRGLISIFKGVLERFRYQVDDCEESLEPLLTGKLRITDQESANQERLIVESRCRVPEEVLVFDAELVLTVDPELGNRRAVLRFVPPFSKQPVRSGGYAQKPGEPRASWDDIISRGIERTLEGYNEPTAISLALPRSATVGETVRLDGRSSWDEDGDSFELRWRITTPGCVSQWAQLPVDHWPCPSGTVNGAVDVRAQSGQSANTREFRVPMIGDYEIAVHSKVGDREEPDRIFHLRAAPRRSRTFFSRVELLRLPTDFLKSGQETTPGLLTGLGYLRRIVHRIGLLGLYEEVHLGVSMSSMQALPTYGQTLALSSQLGMEVVPRVMDRTGRLGLSFPISLNGMLVSTRRQDDLGTEVGFLVETMAGVYYAFGENYLDKRTSYCNKVCPSVTVGPTLTAMMNSSISKFGVSGGVEILMGMEF
jgi:hypothetical protein